jgi:phage/plasmid-like protein (TIGR03299 family)
MSHNLTITNGKAEMFSGQNITPWHGLGKIVAGLLTAKEAIDAASLNWNVKPLPVFVDGKQVEHYQAMTRDDNGKVLSILGKRYTPIQNSDAFEFFDSVIGEGQAVYDTAGSLAEGAKVWIMAKLKGSLFIDSNPNDTIDKNVLLATSHDGSSSLQMMIVATRVVCQNTLSVALSEAQNVIKIRHTKNYANKKDAAMKALGLCNAYFDDLQTVINSLARHPMAKSEMVKFAEKLIPTSEDKEESTRTQNIRSEIVTLFSRGKGNQGKSRWDALNAVTEYVDHSRATRTSGNDANEARFASAMLGSGYNLKDKAFNLLVA